MTHKSGECRAISTVEQCPAVSNHGSKSVSQYSLTIRPPTLVEYIRPCEATLGRRDIRSHSPSSTYTAFKFDPSVLQRLRHENLINLIEVFRRRRKLFLVFEYVDHTVLEELEENPKGLSLDKARSHVFQILRGIEFCHMNNVSTNEQLILNPTRNRKAGK